VDARDSFEIFRKIPDGKPALVEACTTLEDAVRRSRQVASEDPGDYFIFDHEGQRFIDAALRQPIEPNARVLVADDHEAMRKGVRQVLLGHGRVEVVGEASNGREVIEEARRLRPDLIIMDWTMPELDGITAAQLIKKYSPQTAILIFSVHTSRLFVNYAKNLGLEGFVTKGSSNETLLGAVDAVLHHQKYFPA
jgi:CheY-like chemotaxis protein